MVRIKRLRSASKTSFSDDKGKQDVNSSKHLRTPTPLPECNQKNCMRSHTVIKMSKHFSRRIPSSYTICALSAQSK